MESKFCADCSDWISDCNSEIIEWTQNLLYSQDGNGNCEQWSDNCGTGQTITRTGRVYVGGEVAFTGCKLNVKRGIIAKQLFVCTTGWCDYVFEDEYDLPSLEEVQEFVEKNNHLPGIPSAAEIEDVGSFCLNDSALSHQEKIEEIFLYLIDLEKNITQLERSIHAATKLNNQLKSRI